MNTTTKFILIGGASALIGFVSGWFVSKKMLEEKFQKKFEEAVNKEIADIRAYNEKCTKEKEKEKESETENQGKDSRQIDGSIVATLGCKSRDSFISDNAYRAYVTDICYKQWEKEGIPEDEMNRRLEQLAAELEHPEEEEDEELLEPEDHDVQDEAELWNKRKPQILSSEDYADLPAFFTPVVWWYYEEDDVLVDEGEEPVLDVERYVSNALECFGDEAEEYTGNPDILYVAAGEFHLAIEIHRSPTRYYSNV